MTHNGKRQALEVWTLSRCVPEAVSSLSVCGLMGRLGSHAVLIWAVPMPLSDSWQSPQKEIENSQKVFYQRQNYILTPFFLSIFRVVVPFSLSLCKLPDSRALACIIVILILCFCVCACACMRFLGYTPGRLTGYQCSSVCKTLHSRSLHIST